MIKGKSLLIKSLANKQVETEPSVTRSTTTILISSPNFCFKISSIEKLFMCSKRTAKITLHSSISIESIDQSMICLSLDIMRGLGIV